MKWAQAATAAGPADCAAAGGVSTGTGALAGVLPSRSMTSAAGSPAALSRVMASRGGAGMVLGAGVLGEQGAFAAVGAGDGYAAVEASKRFNDGSSGGGGGVGDENTHRRIVDGDLSGAQ